MTIPYTLVLIAILGLSLPYIGRVITGPTMFDRVIGLNAVGTKVPLLLIMIVLIYERVDMGVDVVLALFLLNLVTTLLVAKYVREKGRISP